MSISPSLSEMQEHGFPVGGEPSVALDLVDTVVNAHTMPVDLMTSGANGADAWWKLEADRLPDAPTPSEAATRQLRSALREVFEASSDNREPSAKAVEHLNRVADSVRSSPALDYAEGQPRASTRWHITRGGNARLTAIAHDAIALIADPARSRQLRRCANPTCSMLFLAENPKRVWCASNVCGNRARVARHQQRHTQKQKEAPQVR